MKSRLLRACLRSFPAEVRSRDGEVLLDLAEELALERGVAREAGGLLLAGLSARLSGTGGSAVHGPWREALRMLVLPFALVNACIWGVVLLGMSDPFPLGYRLSVALAGAALLLIGAIAEKRWLTIPGALLAATSVAYYPLTELSGSQTAALFIDFRDGGPGVSIDLMAAWLPGALLLLAASVASSSRRFDLERIAVRGAIAIVVLGLLYLQVELITQAPLEPPYYEPQSEKLLFVVLLALPPLLVLGALIRGTGPALLASALALALWLPSVAWCLADLVPFIETVVAAYWALTLAVGVATIVPLVRLASRRGVPGHVGRSGVTAPE